MKLPVRIGLLLAFAMLLMLAACGGDASPRTTVSNPPPAAPTPAPAPSTTTPTPTPSPSPTPPTPAPAPAPAPTPSGGGIGSGGSAATGYTVQDLGTADGFQMSMAASVNEQGNAAGQVSNSSFDSKAAIFKGGSVQVLGTFGGAISTATGISDSGQVSGMAEDSSAQDRAFLYSDGKMQDLGTLGGSTASASGINNPGQVVGRAAVTGDVAQHAFLFSDGRMQDLGTLGGKDSEAAEINSAGSIAGDSHPAGCTESFCSHAFLYRGGRMQDLGTLEGGASSFGTAINDHDQVAGWGNSNNDGRAIRGFVWSDGKLTQIGVLPNRDQSVALGINNGGVVVGRSGSAAARGTDSHAFVWAGGKLQDLNDLIPADSGWTLQMAFGINDRGQIVGVGMHNGAQHAFLLTPQ